MEIPVILHEITLQSECEAVVVVVAKNVSEILVNRLLLWILYHIHGEIRFRKIYISEFRLEP